MKSARVRRKLRISWFHSGKMEGFKDLAVNISLCKDNQVNIIVRVGLNNQAIDLLVSFQWNNARSLSVYQNFSKYDSEWKAGEIQ